jgi:hypothetical protein
MKTTAFSFPGIVLLACCCAWPCNGDTQDAAFVTAAGEGDVKTLRLFLAAGVNVNARHSDYDYSESNSAILAAALQGRTEAVKLLIESGAKVDDTNDFGATPLILACREAKGEVAKLLIEKGANVNAADKRGLTPLIHVVVHRKAIQSETSVEDFVKLLLASHADPNTKDATGRTALDYVQEIGKKTLVTLLRPVTTGSAEIEGAFGLKLGDVFDISKGKLIPSGDWAGRYEFTPDAAVSVFRQYMVAATPRTHRIHSITAVAPMSGRSEQMEVLKAALVKKYGAPIPHSVAYYEKLNGKRHIKLAALEMQWWMKGAWVALEYSDAEFQVLGRQEAQQIRDSKQASEQRELEEKAKALDKSSL